MLICLALNYINRFTRDMYKKPTALIDGFYNDIGRQGWPQLPLYDPNGHLFNAWPLNFNAGDDKQEKDLNYQQLQFVLEPKKNWKTIAEINYSIVNRNNHAFKNIIYKYNVANEAYVDGKYSFASEDNQKDNRMNFNVFSEYMFNLGKVHNFKALLGMQSDQMLTSSFGLLREGIIIPGVDDVDGTSGTDYNGNLVVQNTYGARKKWATLGYFGRLNYDYRGKYLFEANLRNDGSSRFRSGHRWVW